jgi:hypothetical protein
MLFFGLMAIMFTKHSRFADLKRKLENVKKKKEKLITILVLMISMSGFAQQNPHVHSHEHDHNHTADPNDHANHVTAPPSQKQLDSLLTIYKAPKEHAAKFGRLIIQDAGGRM